MLTLSSQYALRALIYLALHEGEWPVPGRRIAEQAGIPARYLLKILGDLVRAGVLISSPGKHGGFRLCQPADKTVLFDVLAPFEHFERRRCPFGNQECGDRKPCRAHDRWKQVVEAQQRFLRDATVHDVAAPLNGRKRRAKSGRRGAMAPRMLGNA